MSNRWLESRGRSCDYHCAVGCRDCQVERSFEGEEREGAALSWFSNHVCASKPVLRQHGRSDTMTADLDADVAEMLSIGLTRPFLTDWTWVATPLSKS